MEQYKLKIKRISDKAVLPNYAHEGDAGLDLYAVKELILNPGEDVYKRQI